MGEVYLSEDTRLKRKVALKVLPESVVENPDRIERFQREARAVAALNHPNIVTIHSIEEDSGVHFLTMELVEGQTLESVLRQGRIQLAAVVEIASALCDALAYAHEHGIIHRDLKPPNIMLNSAGVIKVLDFGLAKFYLPDGPEEFSTVQWDSERKVMGTAPYMSPEQAQGQQLDARSDIFSLGIILYEMAAGIRPFSGNSPAAILAAILRDPPPPLIGIRPDLPPDLIHIIQRCMEKQLDLRYSSARDVQRDLRKCRRDSPAEGDSAPTASLVTDRVIRAIAVLPLANLSGPDEDFFAEGMTDALITDLAKLGRMKVISRTSALQYKGTTKSLKQIASELSVDAVVEGAVLRSGNKVRITAKLVLAATDEHLWAERYDRQLEDVLALQDELVRTIAREVQAKLEDSSGSAQAAPLRKIDPQVYLLQLRGQYMLHQRTESSIRNAIDLFQQAIAIDPTYAPAFVGLSDTQNLLANYGFTPPSDVLARARAAAERALQLDPASAEAHCSLALLSWQLEFNWQKAIDLYEKALHLNSNCWIANYFYGTFLGVIGHFERSHYFVRKAAELDPLSLLVTSIQGWIHYFAREYDKALPYYRAVLRLDSNYYVANWFLGQALVEQGDFAEGIQALQKAFQNSGQTSRTLGYLGYAYGKAGRTSEAQSAVAELQNRKKDRYVPPYFLALVHSGLGEASQTLDRLEEAYATRDAMIRDLKADSQWDWLHQEPRFQALMHNLNFPPTTPADEKS